MPSHPFLRRAEGVSNSSDSLFPDNFAWGAATASYQIEGAWDASGKGESVWDMLCHQSGKIWERHTGDTACDHYHRFPEDVGLMAEVGLQAYRLSISWPRVLPAGTGPVNKTGLDFYDRLVDSLLAKRITPWVTLFHWDYPYDLFLRGGWLNPDSPKWFADYVRVVVERLSDRVKHWITLNEPQCFIGEGHLNGSHAPGLKLGFKEVLLAAHHVLMAHGMAVQVIRATAKQPAQVGWAPVGSGYYPATDSAADRTASWRAMESVYPGSVWNTVWWADPVILGSYPEEGLRVYGADAPKFTSADLATICQPLDFYGCNVYSNGKIQAGSDGNPLAAPHPPGYPHTLINWPVTPEALYWSPKFLFDRYKLPIVVTENGLSGMDWVSRDGRVHDAARIDFLGRYLLCLHQAIREGVDVRGYFQWSFLDNFEWAEGYKHRFGLVHVDFETQKRTLKDSALWYREVIQTNGAALSGTSVL